MEYSYGIPAIYIWAAHIIIGTTIFYTGWKLYKKEHVPDMLVISLIVLGMAAILYHGHLAYVNWK